MGHGWAERVSSHLLSPTLLPPYLWHHPTLSNHLPCLSFPDSKARLKLGLGVVVYWGVCVLSRGASPHF